MKDNKAVVLLNTPSSARWAPSPSRGEGNSVRGFTLIELLVVVLIIGILAAVAVPQYQKAVEKSRAMEGISLLKSMIPAFETYYLEQGQLPSSFAELNIDLPGEWTGNKKIYSQQTADARSNGEWSFVIQKGSASGINGIHIGRITGPYQGAGFSYIFNQWRTAPQREVVCSEFVGHSDVPFQKEEGEFCHKLFNGVKVYDSSSQQFERYYRLP